MPRLLIPAVLVVSLVSLSGCSKTYQIQIQSDTCWSGTVNDSRSFSDCGNATYKVSGTLHCVRVSRVTPTGALRVRIDDRPWAEATTTVSTVQACE